MTSIITSGCSFTHDQDSWANILNEKLNDNYNVINMAEGGVGQEYIIRSAISALQETPGKKLCMVQLSSSYRVEMIVDEKENPELYKKIVVDHNNDYFEKIQGTITNRKWYRLNDNTVLLLRTTDYGHNWYHHKTTAGKMVSSINKLISGDQRLLWTYEHVARLQWYCKLNNIPLFCFKGWRCTSEACNTELVERSSRLVDWNNVWIHGETGGMADWMIDQGHHGKLDEDHTNNPPQGYIIINGEKHMIGHPTPEAHNDFCEQIIVPWIQKND